MLIAMIGRCHRNGNLILKGRFSESEPRQHRCPKGEIRFVICHRDVIFQASSVYAWKGFLKKGFIPHSMGWTNDEMEKYIVHSIPQIWGYNFHRPRIVRASPQIWGFKPQMWRDARTMRGRCPVDGVTHFPAMISHGMRGR